MSPGMKYQLYEMSHYRCATPFRLPCKANAALESCIFSGNRATFSLPHPEIYITVASVKRTEYGSYLRETLVIVLD